MGGYMAAYAGYAVLSNADVVLVKHYFDAMQAGAFAKAAMVARIVFFLPLPVAAALFPKVASGGETSYASGRTLLKGVLLMGVIVAVTGGFFLLFPGIVLRLLAKTADPSLIPIFRGMVLALAPLTLLSALLTYEVAQRRFMVALPLGLCAVGYVVAAEWMHETPLQIVAVLGVSTVVALAAVVALLPWKQMRKSNEKEDFS
jgi:O-antigen/teichoic acid export membrane protein